MIPRPPSRSALLAPLLGLACGAAGPERPPVVLVSLDTFRADLATPNLAELAKEAVVFERAYAPIPFTLPSHMTLLTGLYPDAHGVTAEDRVLPPAITPLPELLRAAGYRTAGIHTSDWLRAGFGFDRGFDRYEQLAAGLTYADRVTGAAVREVPPAADGRPLFLFLHYLDAHSDFGNRGGNPLPYHASEARRADLRAALDPLPFCDDEVCATKFLLACDRESRPLPPEVVALAHTLYARGAEDLDAELGKLFDALRQAGLWDDAHVIVVSDHGEEFREHGLFIHSQPYEESVRIPFLWKLPGGHNGGRRISEAASLVDVLPTLADLLELGPPAPVQGRSLRPLLLEESPPAGAPRDILVQDKYDPSRRGIVAGRHKLIHREAAEGQAPSEPELYDLTSDPGEARNIAAGQPQTVLTMMESLRTRVRESLRIHEELASAAPAAAPLDDAARERLRSIGYLE